ncbi:MAG TPA: hypothetical protein VG937_04465 [Polyangiaceae bacterium]|nr:hypothetical protein [Polyangiaceae bacterium]
MTQVLLREESAWGTTATELRPFSVTSTATSQAVALMYLVAAFDLGTGGEAVVDWHRASARSGPFTIVREVAEAETETFTTADRVLLVRRWFSLSVAEAARVLKVQRPTIYSWQQGNAPAAGKNVERLRAIFDLAREWRAISSEPVGPRRKEPIGPDDSTLVDLLSARRLSQAAVSDALKRIAVTIERERTRRVASGADLAKRFGFKAMSENEANDQQRARGRRRHQEKW